MATYSAVMSGDSRYTLYLDVTESNVSIPNNTSVVNYALRLVFSQPLVYGAWSSIGKYSLTINGVALASNVTFSYDFRNYSSLTLASGSLTVAHNADGSKTVGCSGYAWMDDGKGSASPSGNFVLATIARASQPRLNTSSQALLSNIVIYTDRASTSFTHTLSYVFGSESGNIAENVAVDYTWTLPATLAKAITNTKSGTGTITCTTYNGSTNIGSKTINFTATVPNINTFWPTAPTITKTGNALLNSQYVKGKSTVTVNSSSTAPYLASISSYKVTVNGQTLYGASVTSAALWTVGTNTISVTATDSRGYTNSNSTTITVADYFSPVINTMAAYRYPSDSSTTLRISIQYTVAAVVGSRTPRGVVDYRVANGTWTTLASYNGGSLTNTTADYTSKVDTDKSYEVRLTVYDDYNTGGISRIGYISSAFSLMNFNASGRGIGIGQVSTGNMFEVNLPTVFSQPDFLMPNGHRALLISPDGDANDIVEPWVLARAGSNFPTTGEYYYINTTLYNIAAQRKQIAYGYITNKMYTRYCYAGTWSDWTTVLTSENIGPNEGTWTPVFGGSTTQGAVSYTVQQGRYYKIGKLVYLYARVDFSAASGGAGYFVITGLPYYPDPNTQNFMCAPNNVAGANAMWDVYGSVIYLRNTSGLSALTYSNISTTTYITISGCYKTA